VAPLAQLLAQIVDVGRRPADVGRKDPAHEHDAHALTSHRMAGMLARTDVGPVMPSIVARSRRRPAERSLIAPMVPRTYPARIA
jgi:hypothetical protein